MAKRKPTPETPRADIEPKGRTQHEHEVSEDVAHRPSNPNQLPDPEKPGREGRDIENANFPVDE